MRLLYFHQHFNTPAGTVGVRSYQMARALIANGHEVTMVCGSYSGGVTGLLGPFSNGRRNGKVDGINVVEFEISYSNNDSFFKRSYVFAKFAMRSTWLALTYQCDIIFATSTPLTAGIPGIVARLVRRKPFVFEVRDLWPELPREMGVIKNPVVLSAMSILEWLSYKSADKLIALSDGIAKGIALRNIPLEKIATIPNGCDFDIFKQPSEEWCPVGVNKNDLLALFAGTHGIANGLEAVLDAASVLQHRGRHDIKFVLIGDGQLKPKLEMRAKQLSLKNIFFLEPVGKRKLAGLMARADIGLQILANVPAFYYGTSPNKFFDYIAAGLPVLNNYPGWLAGLIKKFDCGFIVNPNDPGDFADAMEEAADDREGLKIKGVSSKQLAESQFDRRELSQEFVEWVTELNYR